MAIKVLIPTPLRPFTDKLDTVEVAGTTAGEVLSALVAKHDGLKKHLYTCLSWVSQPSVKRWSSS